MKVVTGCVVDGKIEVAGQLEDGTAVAVLAADGLEFHLSREEEDELSAALAEIHAGDFVDGRDLIRELKATDDR
jgi:hypothetical protein